MVKIYADLVELGYRTIEPKEGVIQVPIRFREDVRLELERRKSL